MARVGANRRNGRDKKRKIKEAEPMAEPTMEAANEVVTEAEPAEPATKAKTPRRSARSKAAGGNKRFETRFGALEVVAGFEGDEMFVVKLWDDVLVGESKDSLVEALEFEDKGNGRFELGGDSRMVPVGQLVGALTGLATHVQQSTTRTETVTVSEEAKAAIMQRKSALEADGYSTEEDEEVGDAALAKRQNKGRKRGKGGKGADDDGDDGEADDDDNDDDDDGEGKPARKRARKKSAAKKGGKKGGKGKTALHPREDIPEQEDLFKVKTGKMELFEGDTHRASREVIRALQSGDRKALSATLQGKGTLGLSIPRSVDLQLTPAQVALTDPAVDAATLTRLLKAEAKGASMPERTSLTQLTSGKHTSRFSDYNRRALQASRGGREGNQAFARELDHQGRYKRDSVQASLALCIERDGLSEIHLAAICPPIPMDKLEACEAVGLEIGGEAWCHFVRHGHREVAEYFAKKVHQEGWSPINFLHLEALQDPSSSSSGTGESPFSKPIRLPSVTKRAQTELRPTPLHFAAINPDTRYLEALLNQAPQEHGILDGKKATLLHYAAACTSPAPLELLLKRFPALGRGTPDRDGDTPLLTAARRGLAANIMALLADQDEEAKKLLLAGRSAPLSGGYTPMHAAASSFCEGRVAAIAALAEAGADVEATTPADKNKLRPLHVAAQRGDLAVLDALLACGASAGALDKLQRSAAHHAAMNGHVHMLARLLRLGVSPDACDTSGNTPLHYAAAYGWEACVRLLLESAGVAPDPRNSWKTTPLELAVQMQRHHVSSILLSCDSIDVNFQGDDGRTLVFPLVVDYMDRAREAATSGVAPAVQKDLGKRVADLLKDAKDQVAASGLRVDTAKELGDMPFALRRLLAREELRGDIADAKGDTLLHLVASEKPVNDSHARKLVALVGLLLVLGCKPDAANKAGARALQKAAEAGNQPLVDLLLSATDLVNCATEDGTTLLHSFVATISPGPGLLAVLRAAKERDAAAFSKFCATRDAEGCTPVLLLALKLVKLSAATDAEGAKAFDACLESFEGLAAECPDQLDKAVGPHAHMREGATWAAFLKAEPAAKKSGFAKVSRFANDSGGMNLLHIFAGMPSPERGVRAVASLVKLVSAAKAKQMAAEVHEGTGLTPVLVALFAGLGAEVGEAATDSGAKGNSEGSDDEDMSDEEEDEDEEDEDEDEDMSDDEDDKPVPRKSTGGKPPLKQLSSKSKPQHDGVADGSGSEAAEVDRLPLVRFLVDKLDADINGKVVGPFASPAEVATFVAEEKQTEARIAELVSELGKLEEADPKADATFLGLITELQTLTSRKDLAKDLHAKWQSQWPVHHIVRKQRPAANMGAASSGARALYQVLDGMVEDLENMGLEKEALFDELLDKGFDSPEACARISRRDLKGMGALGNFYYWQFDSIVTALHAWANGETGGKSKTGSGALVCGAKGLKELEAIGMDLGAVDANGDSTLHHAVDVGAMDVCELLSPRQALHAPNSKAQVPLHLAAHKDSAELLRVLLQSGPASTLDAQDSCGRTALHLAVANALDRKESILEPCETLLLGRGARLLNDVWKRSPLHYAFLGRVDNDKALRCWPSKRSEERDPIQVISALCNADGVDLSALIDAPDADGRTPLHYAAARAATVSSMFLGSRGASIRSKDRNNNSPLAVAMLCSHGTYALMLMRINPDEPLELAEHHQVHDVRRDDKDNVTRREEHSALWYALKNGHEGLVYVMLDAYPFYRAVCDALERQAFQLVFQLVSNCRREDVQMLGADGRTLLHHVCMVPNFPQAKWGLDIASRLLERGVVVDKACDGGLTAAHEAAANLHGGLLRRLAEESPSVVVAKADDGATPLAHLFKRPEQAARGLGDSGKEIVLDVLLAADPLEPFKTSRPERGAFAAVIAEISAHIEGGLEPKVEGGPTSEEVLAEMVARNLKRGEKDTKAPPAMTPTETTPLIQAVASRSQALVNRLFEANKDALQFERHDGNGLTALAHAVLAGDAGMAALLLRLGASPDTPTSAPLSASPLLLAVATDKPAIVRALLAANADPAQAGLAQVTPLHLAVAANRHTTCEILIRAAQEDLSARGGSTVDSPPAPKTDCLVRFGLEPVWSRGVALADAVEMPDAGRVPWAAVAQVVEARKLALPTATALLDKLRAKRTGEHRRDDNTLRQELEQHKGVEATLIGQDKLLTKPLAKGAPVLVNVDAGDAEHTWQEGAVESKHANNSYDVKLVRGVLLRGVLRTALRPFAQAGHAVAAADPARLDVPDARGRTPLSVMVKPCKLGSFDNAELARLLVEEGHAKASAEMAADAARGSALRAFLLAQTGQTEDAEMEVAEEDDEDDLTGATVVPGGLSAAQVESHITEALQVREKEGANAHKEAPPPVNPVCELKSAGLHVEAVQEDDPMAAGLGGHYDVLMTKVDVKHGSFGVNSFYKMQIVQDPIRKLFVLINNWGRIGEYNGGKFQQTPFSTREEALAEFCKVFKSKTGNTWAARSEEAFQPNVRKYKLVRHMHVDYEHPELPSLSTACRGDDVAAPRLGLPAPVMEALEAFTSVRELQVAAAHCGLDTREQPLGHLSMSTVLAAEAKVPELRAAFKAAKDAKEASPVDVMALRAAMRVLADKTSEMLELLPMKEDDENGHITPFSGEDDGRFVRVLQLVRELKELTVASQLVLTAHTRRTQEHPLEYCLRALNVRLEPLAADAEARRFVEHYMRVTGGADSGVVVHNVFEVRRPGESLPASIGNRKLLWHGTPTANMMGVLKQGLRVAPPEASASGYAFGKGIYFADMFSKSLSYCRFDESGGEDDDGAEEDKSKPPRAYLLLAEVALGEENCLATPQYMEKPPAGKHSTVGLGGEEPDPERVMRLAKEGFRVPLGAAVPSTRVAGSVSWGARYCANLDDAETTKLEALRNGADTTFPASVSLRIDDREYKGKLSGPHATSLAVELVKKAGEDEDGFAQESLHLQRTDNASRGWIGNNEYIVYDARQVRIRYMVEVTSRSWLKTQAKRLADASK